MKLRFMLSIVTLVLASSILRGQNKFSTVNYREAAKLTVVGKMLSTPEPFHRVDTTEYRHLPAAVKAHLTHSTGIAISFKSTSSAIYAKWCTDSEFTIAGMTPIAYRGLDLYIKREGKWQFAGVGRPQNGAKCTESKLIGNLAEGEKEFLLYLPAYSTTNSLEIGVDSNETLVAGEYPFLKKVLVYGSSIVQGAGASRPGMVYTSILSRQTGYDVLNLGMSGSAKMEKEVADLVASIDADAYILDCIPNSSPQQVLDRLAYLMQTVRKHHPNAPILVLQSVIRESGYFDQKLGEHVKQQNIKAHQEFMSQKQSGMQNIHFIFADQLLGSDHDGTVDGTHPNDLGFYRMLEVIRPKLVEILTQ